jgi:hypothetical protein
MTPKAFIRVQVDWTELVSHQTFDQMAESGTLQAVFRGRGSGDAPTGGKHCRNRRSSIRKKMLLLNTCLNAESPLTERVLAHVNSRTIKSDEKRRCTSILQII